jgi:hypothetical protein
MALGAGGRLGALAAIAGSASTALRVTGREATALERVATLSLSAMLAALVWGGALGWWLARAATRRWESLRSLTDEIEGLARWCPACWRDARGGMTHGALARSDAGQWSLVDRDRSVISLGEVNPTVGVASRGWGAALLGAPSEPLCFAWGVVYVDRVERVLEPRATATQERAT